MLKSAVTSLLAKPLQAGPSGTETRRADHAAPVKSRSNGRMAGAVPVWHSKNPVQKKMVEEMAGVTQNERLKFDRALSYRAPPQENQADDSRFGVGDLVDMVNPLHHLPVVGSIYRAVTGDEIKPVSRLVGGTVFGGPLGAAGGIVNVVVEHETGRDIAGNVMAMFQKPDKPVPAAEKWSRIAPAAGEEALTENPAAGPVQTESVAAAQAAVQDDPSRYEEATEEAKKESAPQGHVRPQDLPGTVIRYVDLGADHRKVFKYVPDSNARMAGGITHIYKETGARLT